ncbi:MAG: glycosyltransferase family 2 protein, partial [Blastocatellia bacterium]
LSSLIGVSGCMYAVRRSSYLSLAHDLSSDFVIAAEMELLSLRTVYEPDAVCYEETNHRPEDEIRMRVRVIEQTITALSRYSELLDPRRHGLFAFQMLSHKVARYMVPWLLVMAFASNLAVANSSPALRITLLVQGGFYAAALCGLILDRLGVRHKLLAMPCYFVLANLAAALGLIKFLKGESHIVWEPIREARQE